MAILGFVPRDLLNSMGSSTPVTVAIESIKQGLGEWFNNVIRLQTTGGKQRVIIVAEPAATYLLARSNTERGRNLNRFIHIDILPSIRKTGHYQQPAIPTDLPSALRAYAAEIENHQHDSSVIDMLKQQNEMLNQQIAILIELIEICLNQLAFQQSDDPDKATSTAFRHRLSVPFINYIKENTIHYRSNTSEGNAFRKALDQLFIETLEELKTIQVYLELTFRW